MARPAPRRDHRTDEIVVALPHVQAVRERLPRGGAGAVEESEVLGLARVPLPPGEDASGALERLRAGFRADHAGWAPTMGKNRLVDRVVGGGKISYGGGGAPQAVAPPGWAPRSAGPGRGVRVGVLDTGLVPQPWLGGGWYARYSDADPGAVGSPTAADGHATFVAGLVLSQAPGATVEVRRVLERDGSADSWTVATAIAEFGRQGMDVLNLSFLCTTDDGEPPLALAAAVDRLDPDIVVVAAAGNHARAGRAGEPAWPAALDDVVAVGAAQDGEGTPAGFSPVEPWVDLLAPGVDLVSTFLSGRIDVGGDGDARTEEFHGWARWSGTSFAAALVSGAVAAATDPGRTSAHAAYDDIRRALARRPLARGAAGRPLPPYLPLRVPEG